MMAVSASSSSSVTLPAWHERAARHDTCVSSDSCFVWHLRALVLQPPLQRTESLSRAWSARPRAPGLLPNRNEKLALVMSPPTPAASVPSRGREAACRASVHIAVSRVRWAVCANAIATSACVSAAGDSLVALACVDHASDPRVPGLRLGRGAHSGCGALLALAAGITARSVALPAAWHWVQSCAAAFLYRKGFVSLKRSSSALGIWILVAARG